MEQYFIRFLKWFQPEWKCLFGILVHGFSSFCRNKDTAGKCGLVELVLGVPKPPWVHAVLFWEGGCALKPQTGQGRS